jgi:hypothetical protein
MPPRKSFGASRGSPDLRMASLPCLDPRPVMVTTGISTSWLIRSDRPRPTCPSCTPSAAARPSRPSPEPRRGRRPRNLLGLGRGEPGRRPAADRPEWIELEFDRPVDVQQLALRPRPRYGPAELELSVSDDGTQFRPVHRAPVSGTRETTLRFSSVTGRVYRVTFYRSRDPRFPGAARNVQVAEIKLAGGQGEWPALNRISRPLRNWAQKAMHRTLEPFSAPESRPLFEEWPAARTKQICAQPMSATLLQPSTPRGLSTGRCRPVHGKSFASAVP